MFSFSSTFTIGTVRHLAGPTIKNPASMRAREKNEVVEVHILAREAKQLAYPHAGVKRNRGNDVGMGLITPPKKPRIEQLNGIDQKLRLDIFSRRR